MMLKGALLDTSFLIRLLLPSEPLKYTKEQVQWLCMIKDYIAATFHVDKEDFELYPFNKQGGLGKMWMLFGEETDKIIDELNESLVV